MQGSHPTGAQHHWKDSSIADQSLAADLSLHSSWQGAQLGLHGCPSLTQKTNHPNWRGLAGCAGSTVPALQCKSTLSHQGSSSTHPRQLNFKQSRNDGWQQVRPETERKFIHGARTALWHGREEGNTAGHREKAVKCRQVPERSKF